MITAHDGDSQHTCVWWGQDLPGQCWLRAFRLGLMSCVTRENPPSSPGRQLPSSVVGTMEPDCWELGGTLNGIAEAPAEAAAEWCVQLASRHSGKSGKPQISSVL